MGEMPVLIFRANDPTTAMLSTIILSSTDRVKSVLCSLVAMVGLGVCDFVQLERWRAVNRQRRYRVQTDYITRWKTL